MITLGKIQTWSLNLLLLAMVGVLMWIGFRLFDTYEPAEVSQQPLPVEEKRVQRGTRVVYVLDICRESHSTTEVVFTLLRDDGYLIDLGSLSEDLPLGCRTYYNASVVIPEDIETGTFRLLITKDFEVGALRTNKLTLETERFEIY